MSSVSQNTFLRVKHCWLDRVDNITEYIKAEVNLTLRDTDHWDWNDEVLDLLLTISKRYYLGDQCVEYLYILVSSI